MGKQWKQWQTIFLGFKITAGGDCSHEIRRWLLFSRKAMTNLDNMEKQRHYCADKGPYSQGYGLPSGLVQLWELDHKVGREPKNWCFQTVVLEKTLESPLDRKEIKPVNTKINQSWIFIGRTGVEAEAPVSWSSDVNRWLIGKVPDAGQDWGQKEKRALEDEMAGWHHWLDGREFEWAPGVGDGQGGLTWNQEPPAVFYREFTESWFTQSQTWLSN